jgi:type I restriction enzyme M protein
MAKKAARKRGGESAGNGANLGFEQKLWFAADKLRSNMDASEYNLVVLGLIFLKYISDAFEELHQSLIAGEGEYEGADPEDADEYRAENVFWVPKEARWKHLQDNAKQPTIGKLVDEAMVAIERDNQRLKGVLPKDYARPALDKQRLGELIDLIGTIGLGDAENRSKDILGRVYEYFLSQFASAEGKKGGQFYTPRCVVRVLVEMLAPYKGRVYDPCCGSAGMFVQSEKFVEEHGGRIGDIAVYGQESNSTTRRLALMNLAIRGIDGNLGPEHADTFRRDLHKDLKSDYVLANPPFNDSDWHRNDEDVRWVYGLPPKGNANFAGVQHFIHHLAPKGTAGFVLANGSMSSNQSGEGEIRKAIVEADLVDCMVALPGQLFYSTQIPVCLWFLTRKKKDGKRRDRRGETLFLDARKLGTLIDRVHRELTDDEIQRLAGTYHAWRGDKGAGDYEDVPGFCKSAKKDEIAEHEYVLTPGAAIGKSDSDRRHEESLDYAIRQLLSKAISTGDQVIDVFSAAGLKKPDISILSDEFLSEVRGIQQKNVAVELLKKLLNDEIKAGTRRNVVQARSFTEMLKKSMASYHNRAIATHEIIEELIRLAKDIREAAGRGDQLEITDDELAFYDALAQNESAVQAMGIDELKVIAAELVTKVRQSVTIDWTVRESARAKIRVMVRRILRKHGYPPDLQAEATKLVLEQAEVLCADWAA